MEYITSRKNNKILHLKKLAADRGYRREHGEYACTGAKLLEEAAKWEAEISFILWAEKPYAELPGISQACAPGGLVAYASDLKSTDGPVFSVKMRRFDDGGKISKAIILEGVQDPGNVGTVVRTAGAFGIGAVVLTGECADIYNPKTVRSAMGAVFRQRVLEIERKDLPRLLWENGLELYGAALTESAVSIEGFAFQGCAVAIGSEGGGLSSELLGMCRGELIIPMNECCESLNAAVAASIIMWEMR